MKFKVSRNLGYFNVKDITYLPMLEEEPVTEKDFEDMFNMLYDYRELKAYEGFSYEYSKVFIKKGTEVEVTSITTNATGGIQLEIGEFEFYISNQKYRKGDLVLECTEKAWEDLSEEELKHLGVNIELPLQKERRLIFEQLFLDLLDLGIYPSVEYSVV